MPSPNDLRTVRDLAKRYMEIANDPIQDERRDLWRKLNSLERTRPLVYTLLGGPVWKETPEVQPTCEDRFLAAHEAGLRQRIFHASVGDDSVHEPWLKIRASLVAPPGPWGHAYEYIHSEEEGGAWQFDPVIKECADFDKLVRPRHEIDEEATARRKERLEDAVGDILPVCVSRVPVWDNSWHADIITDLTRLRGLGQLMWDLVENPEWLHSVVAWMSETM